MLINSNVDRPQKKVKQQYWFYYDKIFQSKNSGFEILI